MARKPRFIVLSFDIVVIAGFHNPSILNADFLRINNIVPPDWKESENLTTLAISQLAFKDEHISVKVEPERFQVIQGGLRDYPEQTPVCEIVKKYVKTLDHVNYKAVGINWEIAHPKRGPDKWLVRRFMKSTRWQTKGSNLLGSDFTLKFEALGAVNKFALSSGMVKIGDDKPFEAIRINVNANYKVSPDKKASSKADEILQLIDGWQEIQSYVQDQTKRLMTGKIK